MQLLLLSAPFFLICLLHGSVAISPSTVGAYKPSFTWYNPKSPHGTTIEYKDYYQSGFDTVIRSEEATGLWSAPNFAFISLEYWLTTPRVIFIVHGFSTQDMKTNWQENMAKSFLTTGSAHTPIVVDWRSSSISQDYAQAAEDAHTLGTLIGEFAESLHRTLGILNYQFYCVGHGTGAHICGFAGKRFRFGRITGLDPAGLHYWDKSSRRRLDKTDAEYVDVIHTNGGESLPYHGYLAPLGHVDFYPNKGTHQPGCAHNDHVCSHSRAIDMYLESIEKTTNYYIRDRCTDFRRIPESCTDKAVFLNQEMGYRSAHCTGFSWLPFSFQCGIFFRPTAEHGRLPTDKHLHLHQHEEL